MAAESPKERILRCVSTCRANFESIPDLERNLKRRRELADQFPSMSCEELGNVTGSDDRFVGEISRLKSFYRKGINTDPARRKWIQSEYGEKLDALRELMYQEMSDHVMGPVWAKSVDSVGLSVSSEVLSYISGDTYVYINSKVAMNLSCGSCRLLSDYKEQCRFIRKVSSEMKRCGYRENDLFAAAEFVKYFDSLERKELDVDRDGHIRTILKDLGSDIIPDDEQMKAIESDCRNLLLVACAGSGKTTSLAGKIRYLTSVKGIPQGKILVTSFTKKAVDDLKETIVNKMHMNPRIGTFHGIARRQFSDDFANIENFPEGIIRDIIKKSTVMGGEGYDGQFFRRFASFYTLNFLSRREPLQDNVSLYSIDSSDDYELLRDFVTKAVTERMSKERTICGEYVNDHYEVCTANTLYHLGYEYKYREQVKLKDGTVIEPTFLLSNGTIFECRHPYQTDSGLEEICRRNGERYKCFIYPSLYLDCQEGIESIFGEKKRVSINDDYKKLIVTDEREVFSVFSTMVATFISLFKINLCTFKDYIRFIRESFDLRTTLFLYLVRDIHEEYTRRLSMENKEDFDDMIVNACNSLENMKRKGEKLDFDYIMVDEYQDIAAHRADLIDLMADVSDANLVVVGDDWQSIYSFAGSRTDYFSQFAQSHPGTEIMKITTTYRNSKELIDIAGGFVQKNPTQIRKDLVSKKHLKDPVRVVYYENSTTEWPFIAERLERIIAQLVSEGKCRDRVLVITRYTFEITQIRKTEQFFGEKDRLVCRDFPDVDITILNAHRSKGLTFDHVVIISAADGEYGFPSKVTDDPVLELLRKRDHSMPFAEERRLFYVALTRTSNEVYIVAPISGRSVFVKELVEDYHVVRCRELEAEELSDIEPVDPEPFKRSEYGGGCVIVGSNPVYLLEGSVVRDYDTAADPLFIRSRLECMLCSYGEWDICATDDLSYSLLCGAKLPFNMRLKRGEARDGAICVASSVTTLARRNGSVTIGIWQKS